MTQVHVTQSQAEQVAEDNARRLKAIERLSIPELQGWIWAVQHQKREYFPGERAALLRRAQALGTDAKPFIG